MASSVFWSGFYGTASVGSNELSVTQWSISPMVTLVEFKNSKSGPMVQRQSTFGDVSGSMTVDFDFANNPLAAPFNLVPGTILTNLELFLHQSAKSALDGPLWALASIIVEKINQSLAVDGKITTSFDWKGAGGAYTAPT